MVVFIPIIPTGIYYVIIAVTTLVGGAVIYDQMQPPPSFPKWEGKRCHVLGWKEGTNGVNWEPGDLDFGMYT